MKNQTIGGIDLAIDTTDHRSITYKRKGAFKDDLMPYSKQGVISKGSSRQEKPTNIYKIV